MWAPNLTETFMEIPAMEIPDDGTVTYFNNDPRGGGLVGPSPYGSFFGSKGIISTTKPNGIFMDVHGFDLTIVSLISL